MQVAHFHFSGTVFNRSGRRFNPLFVRSPKNRTQRVLLCSAEDIKGLDVYALKQKLDVAIATENYDRAAQLRDVISDRLLDVRLSVEYANRLFYVAFENSDIAAMKEIWSKGDHVQCIHPLAGCIGGYDMVMQSWEAIFESLLRRQFRIVLEDVRVTVTDRMAYVTCLEIVNSNGDQGQIQATNVFECLNDKWMMIHHHGSPQSM